MLKWILFIGLCLVWGSSFILIMRGLEAFTPLQLGAIRIVIAAAVLLPFVIGKAKKVKKTEWKFILLIGLLGNGIPAFLFPLAETRITSASAGILNMLSPLFVLVLGLLFFGFAFTRRQSLGVVLGLIGVLVLLSAGGQDVDLFEHISYSMLVVLATLGYGLSTVMIKKYLNETPPILASGFGLLSVAVPYLIYLLTISDISTVFAENPLAWESFVYVFILGSLGTAVALIMFYSLLQRTNPIFSASITYVMPIVALMWGLLDGEQIGVMQLLGMGIIFIGVFLANAQKFRPLKK